MTKGVTGMRVSKASGSQPSAGFSLVSTNTTMAAQCLSLTIARDSNQNTHLRISRLADALFRASVLSIEHTSYSDLIHGAPGRRSRRNSSWPLLGRSRQRK